MSDITIPGVTSKYNTDKIIKGLVDAEKVRLTRMEKDRDALKSKKKVWQDLKRKLSLLEGDAKELYGFNNPFNEKIAKSSDESVITATASRTALEETKKITVEQIATSDRFKSNSLSKDFHVPPGKYVFIVGKKKVAFNYTGGSLKDFSEKINKRGKNLLRSTVIKDTPDTYVITIESLKTGRENRLKFEEKAVDFALKAGILERTETTERDIPITKYTVQPWTKELTEKSYSLSDGNLTVNQTKELKIPVDPPFKLNKNMVLSIEVKTEKIPEKPKEKIKPPPGPKLPESGEIEFEGIKIRNEPLKLILPQWKPPEEKKRVDDMQVLFIESNGKTYPLKKIEDSEDFKVYQFDVGKITDRIDAIEIRNRNTHRRITIRNARIFDKTARGKFKPLHPLNEAGNARLKIDGIEVERDSNTIDDLIPGVKITLQGKSDKPVELKVERDKEAIKNSIIKLVGHYNQVITEIDVVSSKDESIIDEATYLSDEEKKNLKDKLGSMIGDISIFQLKNKLQSIMMNPYKTEGGRDLSLLAQIGISTDTRKPGEVTTVDKTKLRGYLEINEDKLDEAISDHPEWVKELFGYDTDGDLVVDSGIAYALDTQLKPYIDVGGIIAIRAGTLDNQIKNKNRDIESYKQHLKDYEAELKLKFGKMEGALDALQQNSKALENLGRSNNQGQ